jgi:hypothetical protein
MKECKSKSVRGMALEHTAGCSNAKAKRRAERYTIKTKNKKREEERRMQRETL